MQVMDRQKPLDESQGVLRRLLNETVAEAEELAALKSALRECRQRLHRGALESTRRIVALNSSVASLEALTQAQQSHIRNLEADLALVREQRRQTCWQEEHAVLHNEAHCVWTLKKNLADAHAEYGKLAEERDRLALRCYELDVESSKQSTDQSTDPLRNGQLPAPCRDSSPDRSCACTPPQATAL